MFEFRTLRGAVERKVTYRLPCTDKFIGVCTIIRSKQ
jgi:hypothetical protein